MTKDNKVSCRFLHIEKGFITSRILHHVPRVGEELRFNEELYYKVVVVVWVYDEHESPFERANIGVTEVVE